MKVQRCLVLSSIHIDRHLQRKFKSIYIFKCLIFVPQVLSNPKLCAFNSSNGCVLVADRTILVLDNICQSLHLLAQNGEVLSFLSVF